MIPDLLATSSSGPVGHMPSSLHQSWDQDVDLSHVNVSELATACLIWCLSALTSTVNTSVLSSILSMVRGTEDDIAVKFVSSRVPSEGGLGCLLSCSVLGCWKVGDVWIFFSFVSVDAFQHCSLGLQSFAELGCGFGRDRSFLLHLQHRLCEKPQNIFKSQNNQNLGKKIHNEQNIKI